MKVQIYIYLSIFQVSKITYCDTEKEINVYKPKYLNKFNTGDIFFFHSNLNIICETILTLESTLFFY